MKNVEKYYTLSKILNIVDVLYKDGVNKSYKSLMEFNPAQNNYYEGYVEACDNIKAKIHLLMLEDNK